MTISKKKNKGNNTHKIRNNIVVDYTELIIILKIYFK